MKKKVQKTYIKISANNCNGKTDYHIQISYNSDFKSLVTTMADAISGCESLYRVMRASMIEVNDRQDKLAIEWKKKRELERKQERVKN